MISPRLPLAAAAAGLLCVAAVSHSDGSKNKPDHKAIPTFAKDIAPIVYAKCAPCHHAGEVAPFNLTSYLDAKDKAPTIAAACQSRLMPPWQAISHGQFKDERTLTKDQIATIQAWSDAGAPEGNTSAEPKAPTYTAGWRIGTPDFIAGPKEAYAVAGDGPDEYRCFVMPTNFSEGKYVTAVECRPGNRKVVHHLLVYLDTSGVARKKDGKDGKPGYSSFGGPGFIPAGSLGGWAPGLQPQIMSAGNGFWLPKGADIVVQVHYHKDGKPEEDLSRIGLKFASAPIDKRVRWSSVDSEFIAIPAGDKSYEVKAEADIKTPITLLDVIPHMHLCGHDMKVDATLPDGTKKELINVAPYDFNWQTRYTYKEPIHLPKGTHISLVAHYDNSTDNPHNPNTPPKKVMFGEQTTNEMCFAFFSYTFDNEFISKGKKVDDVETLSDRVHMTIDTIFDHYDYNHDGKLDATELADAVEFFDALRPDDPKNPKVAPKIAAAYLLGVYGKTEKGKMTRDEYHKFLAAFAGKQ